MNELPLNGRNVFNMIELAASVVPQGGSTGTPVGANPFGWGNYQVTGPFRNESAEFLDAQPLNIGYINLPILIPTQDSIQEFRVQTSNLGPQGGKSSGGTRVSVNGQTRVSTSTGSYLCANDKRLHFGLGASEKATVEILCPSGVKQVLNDFRADQSISVREPERT